MQRIEELKICLVGVPVELTEEELLNHLKDLIPTPDFSLELQSKRNGKNFGWGVLTLECRSLYQTILKDRSFNIKGKNVFAKKFMDQDSLQEFKEKFNKRRLFLKGIPLSMNNEELRAIFGKFGDVEDAYLVKNFKNRKPQKKKNNSRTNVKTSYGFVVFVEEEDAIKVKSLGMIKTQGFDIKIEGFRGKRLNKKPKEQKENKKKVDFGKKSKGQTTRYVKKRTQKSPKNANSRTRGSGEGNSQDQLKLVPTYQVSPVAQQILERAQHTPYHPANRRTKTPITLKITRRTRLLTHWGNNLRFNSSA